MFNQATFTRTKVAVRSARPIKAKNEGISKPVVNRQVSESIIPILMNGVSQTIIQVSSKNSEIIQSGLASEILALTVSFFELNLKDFKLLLKPDVYQKLCSYVTTHFLKNGLVKGVEQEFLFHHSCLKLMRASKEVEEDSSIIKTLLQTCQKV